jgi:2-keto-3-deoxy-6-phosphogluconate aldolase
MDAIKPYWKAAVAVLIALLSALQAALLGDEVISNTEWVNVAIAGTTAASVFAAPNVPGARYTKAILAALGAVLVVLTSAIIGGISTSEWIQIALAAFGTVGVLSVPNKRNYHPNNQL